MNWHYVSAGQSVGPVSEADFDKLVQTGTIQPETLVWNETMANWQPLSTARPGALAGIPPVGTPGLIGQAGMGGAPASMAAAPSGTDQVICAECRQSFAASEAVNFGNAWVCAACKPIFVQRMKEGAVSGFDVPASGNLPSDPEELMNLIRQRGYSIDIGSCLSRSWELLKSNFWLVVGATFISALIQQAGQVIPILGFIVVLALAGIMKGGLYSFFIKLIRGQSGGLADIFSGFGPRWAQLMLVTLFQGLIIVLIAVPGVLVFMGAIFAQRGGPGHGVSPLLLLIVPVLLVPMVYLGVSWILATALVIDRGLNAWPAMELSRKVVTIHWGTFFAMAIIGGLLSLAGVLACVVGVFVAIPLFTGMLMFAYDDIFGTGRALGA